jgi:hypothetical protein
MQLLKQMLPSAAVAAAVAAALLFGFARWWKSASRWWDIARSLLLTVSVKD